MADEMARRIAEDGGQGLPEGGAAAPGNEGGSPPVQSTPPAGAINTDTSAGGGAPDTIPYSRFKEVNDRYNELRGFEELVQYGYDADSLRRLAAFEANYLNDPNGTWIAMAENLDLPQPVMDAIKAHVSEPPPAGDGGGRAEGGTPSGGEPATQLSREDRERLEYIDQLRAREADAQSDAQLASVMKAWDSLDEKDNIKTPERMKLMAISQAASAGGQFRTHEDLAKAARDYVLEYRSDVLGSAIRTGRGGSSPPPLPSGAAAGSGPVQFKNIREATKAAEAAIARGELPSIQT
jgi:hypothetical protein